MTNTAPDPTHHSASRRLDSWKEIAAYLGRDVRTVQRWERTDDLPVRRLQHAKLASVYAYTNELEAWRESREPAGTPVDPVSADPQKSRIPIWLAALVPIVALFSVGLWTWSRSGVPQPADPSTISTIAVLPIVNFSGDPEQEYFSDAMTDALITQLSTIPRLFVISRTSVMTFKNSRQPVRAIAKALNVDAVVEGSVTRSAGRVRVTAKLIRAATDTTLWAQTFDRDASDVLALQSDVAEAIARQVEASLSRDDLARLTATRAVAADVFEHYVKGMALVQNDSRSTVEEAVRHLEAAVAGDPTFAPAYVGLASAYNLLGTYSLGVRSPAETRPKAAAAATAALKLDPNLIGGYRELAYVEQREWRWSAAEAGYRRAIRLSPGDSRAHANLADLLSCQGRFDEAIALARRARDMDPLSVWRATTLGMVLYFARRYDEAAHELRAATARHPEDATAHWYLGNVLMATSRFDEAIESLERSVAGQRNPGPLGFLASAYAKAGRFHDAERVVDELSRLAQRSYVPPAAFVVAYSGLGDRERAFAALEQAYEERSNLIRSLKVLPVLDPLRDDPRFTAMVRRVGLE